MIGIQNVALRKFLTIFQRESNFIEGIEGVQEEEIEALFHFVQAAEITKVELVEYVKIIQPNAQLRSHPGIHGVRVGNHIAPPSGPDLMRSLQDLLNRVNKGSLTPHAAHCKYENLHPFTDGNGRSGRALWLWMRRGDAPLGFLHTFYYETLSERDHNTGGRDDY